VVDPFFLLVLTNPYTQAEKTATITPEGSDGKWILNIIGVAEAYEDLAAGEINFDQLGTWEVAVHLNSVSNLLRNWKFQIV